MSDTATTLTGIASGSMAMGGGFLTAFTAPGEDAANAGLFVGLAGVVGTVLTSITPWVREWFADRKEERAFRAQRLRERLDEAERKLAQVDANTVHTAELGLTLNDAIRTLKEKGVLAPDEPYGRPRLLLVEDDNASADALRRLVDQMGFATFRAERVVDALALLDTRPAAVLLDLMLPDGSGVEVLRAAKAMEPPVRVIVTSAMHDPETLAEVATLGADAVLSKPITNLSSLIGALKA